MSGVRQGHLPHRDRAVTRTGSSTQHQQQIRQMLGYIFILFVIGALLPEGLVLESQTASKLLRPILDQFGGSLFGVVTPVLAERLQLDGPV